MEIYTRDEIYKHNTSKSCWLIVNNKVYDVTKWLPYHPAGINSILNHAGKDCTKDFYFHSQNAIKFWRKYKIGYTEDYIKCTIL